jgi:hypothetical protein
MRCQLLGIGQRWIQVIFKSQSHNKRRPTITGVHALAIQIRHGNRQIITGCNPRFAVAIWAVNFHAKTSSSFKAYFTKTPYFRCVTPFFGIF